MKLFIVTCLRESQDDVAKIFKQANIHVFSASPIIGFRDNQQMDIMDSWFASGDQKMDSMMLFSFTEAKNADCGMELIKIFNKASGTDLPIRCFIVPVEKSGL
ncbi:MAG: hypothetical protein Q8918_00620 [Bacteroidota bacterium]|nr:hypothetical protein [Bacteroidota bacterium]MDP4248590.1 hypothetical protein [Bacteroidota bacterium]